MNIEKFKNIDGFNLSEFRDSFLYYGPHSNFIEFACYVNEHLPEGCTAKLVAGTQAIKVSYKNYTLSCAYMSVNDKEIHLDSGKNFKKMKINGDPDGCARRFLKTVVEPRILTAKEQERKEEEVRVANANKVNNFLSYVIPDEKDIYRAETAWERSHGLLSKYIKFLDQQLNKITDPNKAKRRIKAFYDHLLSMTKDNAEDLSVNKTLSRLKNRMLDHMNESYVFNESEEPEFAYFFRFSDPDEAADEEYYFRESWGNEYDSVAEHEYVVVVADEKGAKIAEEFFKKNPVMIREISED